MSDLLEATNQQLHESRYSYLPAELSFFFLAPLLLFCSFIFTLYGITDDCKLHWGA